MATEFESEGRPLFQLPPVIRRYEWRLIYLLLWAPYIALYQIANRYPLREPMQLSFSWLDQALPFSPALLPIYVCYLPFYFWTVARSENDREANRVFYGTHLQLLLSLPVFVVMPVTMPRELFYGPELYGWADAFWRWFDAPNNCFPSLHASNCLLFMQFNWQRRYRALSTVMGSAIICSAVLVKQHYVVDMAAGAMVYVAARWFLSHAVITGIDKNGQRRPLLEGRDQLS